MSDHNDYNYSIKLTNIAMQNGASNAGFTEVKRIKFKKEFRDACAANACGMYGKSWTCPPAVGDIETLIQRATQYQHAFVYQTIWEIEDSFDFEGMEAAGEKHSAIASKLQEIIMPMFNQILPLAAGSCRLCEKCTKPEDKPCRFPDQAMASLEAYGIAVSELAALCGMKYINGENTVTYFGAFLFNDNN